MFFDAYMSTAATGAFSYGIHQNTDLQKCREAAKKYAKDFLNDESKNPAHIGCALIVIKRSRKLKAFDNRVVESFVVLK